MAMTLPLFDQVPAMDAALTEQLIVEVPNFTVAVSSSGLALLRQPLLNLGERVYCEVVAGAG